MSRPSFTQRWAASALTLYYQKLDTEHRCRLSQGLANTTPSHGKWVSSQRPHSAPALWYSKAEGWVFL